LARARTKPGIRGLKSWLLFCLKQLCHRSLLRTPIIPLMRRDSTMKQQMIFDHRTYNIKPNRLAKFLETYERLALPCSASI
jgi:hypothetical protein